MIHRNFQWRSKNFNSFYLVVVLFSSLPILLIACGTQNSNSYPSPPGYDFSKPYRYKMPTILDEISGVYYYPKDSSIFAIQDEKGWLFKIRLKTPLEVERWKFSNAGDYEDLSLVDSTFYVLKSKGFIEKFKFSSADSISLQSFKVPGEEKNEFETLFYDSTLHQLILICKNCEDDKRKEVSSWAFDPVTDSFSSSFTIKTSKIRVQLNDDNLIKP